MYLVLHWILERKDAIRRMSLTQSDVSHDDREGEGLTEQDVKLLAQVVGDTDTSKRYWLAAECFYMFAEWGAKVSGWMHGCLCHQDDLVGGVQCDCPLKGRRSAEFAGSGFDKFSRELRNMVISADLRLRLQAAGIEEVFEGEFIRCRSILSWRFTQVFGFWKMLPWAIVAIYEGEIDATRLDASRLAASQCLKM